MNTIRIENSLYMDSFYLVRFYEFISIDEIHEVIYYMNSVTVVGIDIILHDNSFYYKTNSCNAQIHLISSVSMNSFQSMKSMKSLNI